MFFEKNNFYVIFFQLNAFYVWYCELTVHSVSWYLKSVLKEERSGVKVCTIYLSSFITIYLYFFLISQRHVESQGKQIIWSDVCFIESIIFSSEVLRRFQSLTSLWLHIDWWKLGSAVISWKLSLKKGLKAVMRELRNDSHGVGEREGSLL